MNIWNIIVFLRTTFTQTCTNKDISEEHMLLEIVCWHLHMRYKLLKYLQIHKLSVLWMLVLDEKPVLCTKLCARINPGELTSESQTLWCWLSTCSTDTMTNDWCLYQLQIICFKVLNCLHYNGDLNALLHIHNCRIQSKLHEPDDSSYGKFF